MRLLFLATLVALLTIPASAGAHRRHGHCDHHCLVRSRHHFQKRVIAPYRGWLASTGHCESANYPAGYSLRAGLRAIGGGGLYRGRYQMTFHIWGAVGGRGDPAAGSWLEQAYRATLVLSRYGNGQWPVCGH